MLAKAGEISSLGETRPDIEDETEIERPEGEAAGAEAALAAPPHSVKMPENNSQPEPEKATPPRLDKPVVTLSLTVDATSDPEKLEKQLKLLRQYGVI